ncbi:hypothetical protein OWV82_013228 [Melia azedarach]|uniref:Uncharacterized protein n=1 Tax=Melia azedarach TaxID=155640 RepID=A0ACC1XV62_MELAZ|nr:hypothetical protein OWV82_013228 [Melia azedarach]
MEMLSHSFSLGENISKGAVEPLKFGKRRRHTSHQAGQTMRHSFLVLMILTMLLLSQSSSVNCRALRSAEKNENTDRTSSSSSSHNSVEGMKTFRAFVKQDVFTLAAGPSRKGSGH